MAETDLPPPVPLADEFAGFVRRNWIALLAGLHCLKWAFWLRAVDFSSSYPLTNVDYSQFYGRAVRTHEFLLRSGRIWGYDPFDMAGYLSGPFLEVGTHFLSLMTHLLQPLVPMSHTTLFLEVVGLVGAPFLLVTAADLLGATRKEAWSAFGVGVVMLGTLEAFSNGMYKVGLWGWMTSCFIAPVQVGLFWRWAKNGGWRGWALFTAVTLLSYQIHPSIAVVIILPDVLIYIALFREMPLRRHAALAAAAALTIAANWYWMSAFIAFRQWRVTAPYYDTAGFKDILRRFGPVQEDFYTSVRAFAHLFVLLIAVDGWRTLRLRQPRLAAVVGVWILWLAVVAYFGSDFPGLRTIQPGRNEFPLWIVLYLLAGFAVEERVWRRPRPRAVAAAIAIVAAAYATPYPPGDSPWSKYAPPLGTHLLPWQDEVIRHLNEVKPRDVRAMIECNDDLNPNFADLVPFATHAILIGGQHPGNFLRARSTIFSGLYVVFQGERSDDAIAFGHPIREIGENRFAQYLDLYNVGLIYASTNGGKSTLDKMTDTLELIESKPPLNVYRVRRKPSWFVEGRGDVRFDYDRIFIGAPSPGRLILKAHWLSTFAASPAVPIRPIYLMDDPVPFIEIDNKAGYKRIEIYNAGLPPLLDRLAGRFHDNWGHP